jgi:peroxiredoxin
MRRRDLLAASAALLPLRRLRAGAPKLEHPDGSELVGRTAPPLKLSHWLNSQPLEMSDLRGKVVLVRWWTQGCPYCEATGPALRTFQRKYESQGLQIVGVYHPKPAGNWDMQALKDATAEKQFTFPVALDGDWTALKRWWLDQERDFTSVSFVVDRRGIIRYVHPGGEFHEGAQGGFDSHESCNRDYRTIEATIQRLLAEPA